MGFGKILTSAERGLSFAEGFIMAAFFSVAACLGLLQVVLRYGFATGIDWVEQALIILVVDAALVGSAIAVRRGTHVRLDILVDALAARPRRIVLIITNLLCLAFTVALAVFGVRYVQQIVRFETINIESGFADWVHYGGVPVAMSLMAFRYVQQIWLLILSSDDVESDGLNQ